MLDIGRIALYNNCMKWDLTYRPTADHDEFYKPTYVLDVPFTLSFSQERGITEEQFCCVCGITYKAYKLFLETREFSMYFFDVAQAIARVMGVQIFDLYRSL